LKELIENSFYKYKEVASYCPIQFRNSNNSWRTYNRPYNCLSISINY